MFTLFITLFLCSFDQHAPETQLPIRRGRHVRQSIVPVQTAKQLELRLDLSHLRLEVRHLERGRRPSNGRHRRIAVGRKAHHLATILVDGFHLLRPAGFARVPHDQIAAGQRAHMQSIVQRPVGAGQRLLGRFQREHRLLGQHIVHIDGSAFLGNQNLLRIVGMPAHRYARRAQVEHCATVTVVLVGPHGARVVVADGGQIAAVRVPGHVVYVARVS